MSKPQRQTTTQRNHRFRNTNEQMEQYFADHPRSPSAVRRPQIFHRSGTFVALLGLNLQNGIAGLGNTVEAALRAFDMQYLRALRPPAEETSA